MRRVAVVLALLVLALPVAASASGIDITNKFGSISITSSGITSTGAQVLSFGSMSVSSGALGSLFFQTGACLSGCNGAGIPGNSAIFSSVGSVFDVVCRRKACGGWGAPLFTGWFTGPITWTLDTTLTKGGNLVFDLTGTITGTLANGHTVSGTTTQQFFTAAAQLNSGIAHIRGGSTNLVVPEPGTLGLLGTGLVGIAGMLRRKIVRA